MDVTTTRHCLALDLKDDPGLIERYAHWHRPGGPPAAVTRSIRESGIASMEIWSVSNRLFMVMEVGPDFDPARKAENDASDPDVIAWERLMWEFQQPLPSGAPGEKWVEMHRIFSLDEQP